MMIFRTSNGKVFGTNAKNDSDLEKIKSVLLKIEGVKDVIINNGIFPKEFTVHTLDVVKVDEIEHKVIGAGFHAIPKGLFEL